MAHRNVNNIVQKNYNKTCYKGNKLFKKIAATCKATGLNPFNENHFNEVVEHLMLYDIKFARQANHYKELTLWVAEQVYYLGVKLNDCAVKDLCKDKTIPSIEDICNKYVPA